MAKELDQNLLDRLCIEIENAWETNRDDSVVDRLAAAHPEYAEALYNFFSLLIDVEIGSDSKNENMLKSDERTRTWLEQEGYRQACNIAREECHKSTSASPDPPPSNVEAGPAITDGTAKKGSDTSGSPSLLALLCERTGDKPSVIASKMDVPYPFLLQVQRYPKNVPEGAREELASRAEKAGGNREEVSRCLEHSFQGAIAASRDSPYPVDAPSYAEMVKRSRMSPKDKQYWLSFISGSPDETAR